MGGTFDPPHRGHLNVAVNAVRSGVVDEVWLMVSPKNPFKSGKKISPAEDRVRMCRMLVACPRLEDDAAVEDCKILTDNKIKVSDFELSLPLPSYMINTLSSLKREHPDCDFRLIIGSDNLKDFSRWRDSERIRSEFGLIVYPRYGFPTQSGQIAANSHRKEIVILDEVPLVDISSTQLRAYATEGPIGYAKLEEMTSPEVAHYIISHKLYN